MTPAINLAKKHKIKHNVHQYEHDENAASYGLEAAQKMDTDPQQIFKTLVVSLDDASLAVAIVPVQNMLSLKVIAKVLGAKKAMMADKDAVQRSTGYVLGGVSPLGQKKRLKTVLDESAMAFSSIYVSAGKRGLEIELDPVDLLRLTQGESHSLCQ
jgi:Cys-tRNA(Pro)/Cys-tRNA(Cys) deacylase